MSHFSSNQDQAQLLHDKLIEFVGGLLQDLDAKLDKRLVKTFVLTLQAILSFRHSRYGLLLSELGAYILSAEHAPAGTKRLSNLLRSHKWTYRMLSNFLWRKASEQVSELEKRGAKALVIWDESIIEKPESIALEGLCPVRSSQAARLKRIKPGYFNPPQGRPVFVPGMQWLSLLLVGMEGHPVLAAMYWWTTLGKFATKRAPLMKTVLHRCARAWGQRVIHVWDRGFANSPWLGMLFVYRLRFVLRWVQKNHLVDGKGKRNAWKITRGKRSLDHRLIWDARRSCWRKTGIIYQQVTHPDYPNQILFLVVSRPGKGKTPWYLLTNETIETVEAAWAIVFIYARRWQIEMTYRYSKTELAMQSPRLWAWENRLKLLLMVSLVYAFLLSLMDSRLELLRVWLLRHWCHRTGKRYREVSLPLYRLRSALSRLWLSHPPLFLWQNSG
jgi:hypothetical protein